MPEFTVPQFIEHEPKIIGPLTFRQFVYVGIAGGFSFILYFTVQFYFFILGATILMLGASTLAFGKSGGRSLPSILKNFFTFSFSPKIYLWRKKIILPPKLIEKKTAPVKAGEENAVPTIVGKSRLKDLSNQVEVK